MKTLKPNVRETRKIPVGQTGKSKRIPNPQKYIGKVIKGELDDKNSRSTL